MAKNPPKFFPAFAGKSPIVPPQAEIKQHKNLFRSCGSGCNKSPLLITSKKKI